MLSCNNRSYRRIIVGQEAQLVRMDGMAMGPARIVDISNEGLALQSSEPVRLGVVYTVLFRVPHQGGDTEVFAMVDPVYSQAEDPPASFRTGFTFRHIGMNHAALILNYLSAIAEECSPDIAGASDEYAAPAQGQ